MGCSAIAILGQNLPFSIQTRDGTGAPATPDDDVIYKVYEGIDADEILSGTMIKDFDSKIGQCAQQIAITADNGFEVNKCYMIYITCTVAGVSLAVSCNFICLSMPASIADAVCNEPLSEHTTPGTLGKKIGDITLTGLGTTAVDHNYGGTDALRYVDGVGSGIDNADIVIYLKSDYDAGNLAAGYVKAKTNTDVNGRWANPLNLDPAIYTIYFYKQGEYGPDTQEITVT